MLVVIILFTIASILLLATFIKIYTDKNKNRYELSSLSYLFIILSVYCFSTGVLISILIKTGFYSLITK